MHTRVISSVLLLGTLEGAPLLLDLIRLGSGFLLLLVPATAVGATLALLVRALLAGDATVDLELRVFRMTRPSVQQRR